MSFLGLKPSDLIPGGPVVVSAGKANDALSSDKKMSLSALLASAGFTGGDAIIARAISLAENASSNPRAEGHNTDRTTDVGLMQINSSHAGEFGSPANKAQFIESMKDPAANVKFAYQLYTRRHGFGDWVTYNTGKYRLHMPKPRDPTITLSKNSLTGDIGGAVGGAVNAVTSPFESLANLVSVLFQADTWARVGKGALGGTFVILGTGAMVFIIANKSGAIDVAKKVV